MRVCIGLDKVFFRVTRLIQGCILHCKGFIGFVLGYMEFL